MAGNTPAEQDPEAVNAKYNKRWACIAGILIGVIMILCGVFSMTGNSAMDNAFISGGTTQACNSLIETYPEASSSLEKIANALEAAMDAREKNSPDKMNAFVESYFSEYALQQGSVNAIIQSIMIYVNSAYEKSETEEEYWEKVRVIISGIRSALSSAKAKAA